MKILALDLGTKTGWMYGDPQLGTGKSGTWTLATDKEVHAWGQTRLTRRCDPRVPRLIGKLTELCEDFYGLPDLIVFEDVQFLSYTKQCQLWSSLRAAVWVFHHYHAGGQSHIDCVDVTRLKKFATGYGQATKDHMLDFLKRRHPALVTPGMDDNAVDASWLWVWAEQTYKRLLG
jgi:hypothetical protein